MQKNGIDFIPRMFSLCKFGYFQSSFTNQITYHPSPIPRDELGMGNRSNRMVGRNRLDRMVDTYI